MVLRRFALGIAMVGVISGLAAFSVVTAQAPTTSETSRPSTAPSTAPSDEFKELTAVKRQSLKIVIDAEGWFEAIDPFEVRIRPEAYQGELRIVRAAPQGAKVSAGEVLLEIKSDEPKRQLLAAENELTVAQANLAKAEADLKFGNESDVLAARHEQTQLTNAQKSLQWWDENDSSVRKEMTNFQVGVTEFYVESSADELEELRKMYKAEDLASVTADLVIKRSMRILDLQKRQLGIIQGMAKRMLGFDIELMRQMMTQSLESMQLELARMQSVQEHGRIMRETSLVSAKTGRDQAQEKVNDLKKDLAALTIKSPIEGVVIYGAYNNGNWQETDERQLQPGETLQANQVVMTIYQPGRLRARMKLPEQKLFWVASNAGAKVIPAAASDLVYQGTLGAPSMLGASEGDSQSFDLPVELPAVDHRFKPGYRAIVKIDAGTVENALVVPKTAISRGRVWVREGEDKDTPRDVITGKSDDVLVEIKSGLSEGEMVLTQAKQ